MIATEGEQRVGLLGPSEFHLCWESILQSLEAIPHFWEYYTKEWFYERVCQGSIQVWAIGSEKKVDMIVTTEIVQYPAMKVFRLMGASGKGLDLYAEKLHDIFDGFAAMQDCQRVEFVGRRGWLKKFGPFWGSTYDYIVMSRPVGFKRSH